MNIISRQLKSIYYCPSYILYMLDFYTISVIVFLFIVFVSVYTDRGNIKREGIVLLRRTQRGKRTLIKIGTKLPRLWKVIGMASIFVGFYFSIVGFLSIFQLTVSNLVAKKAVQGLALLLPSPTSQTIIAPGVFAPPFWYFIISIALLVVVHEGMHGIVAAAEKVRIKTLGLILLVIIPGAFVDIDEKQLRKEKHWKQLRIFASGSFGNFALAFACGLLFAFLAAATQMPYGVGYGGYVANYSASKVNLSGVIVQIGGYNITSITDMEAALGEIGPSKTITLKTLNSSQLLEYSINTSDEPWPNFTANILVDMQGFLELNIPGSSDSFESGYGLYMVFMGMSMQTETEKKDAIRTEIGFWNYTKNRYPGLSAEAEKRVSLLNTELDNYTKLGFIGIASVYTAAQTRPGLEFFSGIISFILGLLGFTALINLGVGIVNLLPLWITDGARMWELVFMRISRKRYKKILKAVSYFVLLMILLNFLLPYKPF